MAIHHDDDDEDNDNKRSIGFHKDAITGDADDNDDHCVRITKDDDEDDHCVRISAPVSVMRTVCSICAVLAPSTVTAVQPSARIRTRQSPSLR